MHSKKRIIENNVELTIVGKQRTRITRAIGLSDGFDFEAAVAPKVFLASGTALGWDAHHCGGADAHPSRQRHLGGDPS